MKQIKTSELTGKSLDYCVAKCENNFPVNLVDVDSSYYWTHSSDWSQGGPVIVHNVSTGRGVGVVLFDDEIVGA